MTFNYCIYRKGIVALILRIKANHRKADNEGRVRGDWLIYDARHERLG